MVDTPRTLAEILSLFADNSTGQISPQDLRDFVVSLTNPVAAGGFDQLGGVQSAQNMFAQSPAYTLDPYPTAWGHFNISNPLTLVDPMGLMAAAEPEGDYVSSWWGETFPEGTWFRLPRGQWAWSISGSSNWGANLTGRLGGAFYYIDNRMNDGFDTFVGDPLWYDGYGGGFWSLGPTFIADTGVNSSYGGSTYVTQRMIDGDPDVYPDDSGLGLAVAPVFYQIGGTARSINYNQFNLLRIGNA